MFIEVPAREVEPPTRAADRSHIGFMAMHAPIALCAASDTERLRRLHRWCLCHVGRDVAKGVGPPAASLLLLTQKQQAAADGLNRLGGSDAGREVVGDTRMVALLASGRCHEAQRLLDRRVDRRSSARDVRWHEPATRGADG